MTWSSVSMEYSDASWQRLTLVISPLHATLKVSGFQYKPRYSTKTMHAARPVYWLRTNGLWYKNCWYRMRVEIRAELRNKQCKL